MEPTIVSKPWPGMAGEVISLHGAYYARAWSLAPSFECEVGQELCAFLSRPEGSRGAFWAARDEPGLMGFLALQPELPGEARLRWFIVREGLQGRGLGRLLLTLAIDHARASGLARLHLWTFAGLDAARRLYEDAGFALTCEEPSRRWGPELTEQRFDLSLS